jgi:hypothetical protein
MKEDPTMVELKSAAKKAGVLKIKLIDLTVADVFNFLIEAEKIGEEAK